MLCSPLVDKIIELALLEDSVFGDTTSELCVPKERIGQGIIIARENFIVCGLPLIEKIVRLSGANLEVDCRSQDGAGVSKNSEIAILKGEARQILTLERTILNFLQRLSGCATATHEIVQKANGIMVADTRKTTPGWRVLEKYAVRTGGGRNHRLSLGDQVLVKDNHIDANGGDMKKTLEKVFSQKGVYTPVEVEVRNLKELNEAVAFHPTVVMLDNMNDSEMKEAIQLVKTRSPHTLIEISGGVKAGDLARLKSLGAEIVSMGALTSGYKTVDISLDIKV